MSESSRGEYMKFRFPQLLILHSGIIAILLMTIIIFLVKAFGEFEFWVALIKVVTIILMIIAGFGLIFFGFKKLGGDAVGISILWRYGRIMWMVLLVSLLCIIN